MWLSPTLLTLWLAYGCKCCFCSVHIASEGVTDSTSHLNTCDTDSSFKQLAAIRQWQCMEMLPDLQTFWTCHRYRLQLEIMLGMCVLRMKWQHISLTICNLNHNKKLLTMSFVLNRQKLQIDYYMCHSWSLSSIWKCTYRTSHFCRILSRVWICFFQSLSIVLLCLLHGRRFSLWVMPVWIVLEWCGMFTTRGSVALRGLCVWEIFGVWGPVRETTRDALVLCGDVGV